MRNHFRHDILSAPREELRFALSAGTGSGIVVSGSSTQLVAHTYATGAKRVLAELDCRAACVGPQAPTGTQTLIVAGNDSLHLVEGDGDDWRLTTLGSVAAPIGQLVSLNTAGDNQAFVGQDSTGEILRFELQDQREVTSTRMATAPIGSPITPLVADSGTLELIVGVQRYRLPTDDEGPREVLLKPSAPFLTTLAPHGWDGGPRLIVAEQAVDGARVTAYDITQRTAEPTECIGPWGFISSLASDERGFLLIAETVVRDDGVPLTRRPRVLLYESFDALVRGDGQLVEEGTGSVGASLSDLDGDGEIELIGVSPTWPAEVQVFKRAAPTFELGYRAIDTREFPSTDLLIVDLDGDGRDDIISGRRWYRAPGFEPHELSEINQVIAAVDLDDDGQLELIATAGEKNLDNQLVWLDYIGGLDEWRRHALGTADADWPHGAAATPNHPELGPFVLTAYHRRDLHPPQLWTPGPDPTKPWAKRTLADLLYGEQMVIVDLDGDGQAEIVAGPWILRFDGEQWAPRRIADETYSDITRVRVADVDGDGRLDVIVSEEGGDWPRKVIFNGRISWFRQPEQADDEWVENVVAIRTCPHSLDVADIDGDGAVEIIVGEHDPFTPEDADVFCRLSVFKRLDLRGRTWSEHVVDNRFEHHVGAQAIRLEHGMGIVSQGWSEPRVLHLWEP